MPPCLLLNYLLGEKPVFMFEDTRTGLHGENLKRPAFGHESEPF